MLQESWRQVDDSNIKFTKSYRFVASKLAPSQGVYGEAGLVEFGSDVKKHTGLYVWMRSLKSAFRWEWNDSAALVVA